MVKLAIDYKYLGILFGPLITTKDVYAKSLTGLVDCPVRFAPSFLSFSHSHRVLAVNIYIITKISYLVKFFNIPSSELQPTYAEGAIKTAAAALIIRSKTAYPYFHLVGPKTIVSPCPPIRDS